MGGELMMMDDDATRCAQHSHVCMIAPGPMSSMYTQMTINDAGTQPNTIDACGVCGGDESECAIGNAPLILNNRADAQNERGVHALDLDGISY